MNCLKIKKHNSSKRKFKFNLGFTLVELLIAIAIFAVLSALGWKVFDYLIKTKERNAMHEESLNQLQEAYLQLQRDSLQVIPLTANIAGQIQPALVLNNQNLSFTKSGVSDPLKQGISPYERVEYQYDQEQKKLFRLKYSNINVSQNKQPVSSVVLNDVDQFQVTVLNPGELNQWPDQNVNADDRQTLQILPKGIRIKLVIREVEYDWVFSLLNTDYLKKKTEQNNNQN